MSSSHDRFAALFAQSQNRVYGYVRTLLPNRSDAEEAFQQTVFVLWRTWEQYDAARDFVPWACRIAHLEVQNFIRKRNRHHEFLSAEAIDSLAATSEQSQPWLEDRRAALSGCMEKLSVRDRQLLESAYEESKPLHQLAPTLGKSRNALYKSLRKIRHLLMECIERTLATEGC